MDDQIFETLLQAAQELEWSQEEKALIKMREIYEQKLYFVAFIGQYSTGKSHLINNLLRRDLLPKGVTETTPLLTYIRYGEREQARLHYLDGAVQLLSVKDVADLIQANSTAWDMDSLDYLEVFLEDEMLRQGMILLDTPGINTLIQRHEQLLASSLAMAAKIIYVTGRAPTKVDSDELRMLAAQGFDISFVRTHCDEIRAFEESGEAVVEADHQLLSGYGISAEDCYHVSNQEDSHWFAAIEPIRQMLRQKGGQAAEELKQAMAQQLSALAKRFCAALEEQQALLSAAHDKNAAEMEKKRLVLERQIQELDEEICRRRDWLKGRITECGRTLETQGVRQIEQMIDHAAQRIADSKEDISTEKQMGMLMRQVTQQLTQAVYQTLNGYIDPLITEINGDLDLKELPLNQLALPQIENYAAVRSEQNLELEQLRGKLLALRSDSAGMETRLQELSESPEYARLCQELMSIEAELVQLQEKYAVPYVPQMIELEDGRRQPSEVGRTIGNLLDWALLFIPGADIGAGVAKLGESSKVVSWLAKTIGGSEKVIEIFKKGDSIKDTVFALQNMTKTYATAGRKAKAADAISKAAKGVEVLTGAHKKAAEQQEPSFLDYLTLQHWGEQIGRKFDRPPQVAVDLEYENEYRAKKVQLEQQLREKQQLLYQKKLKLNLFKSEKERMEAEKASLIVNQQAVEEELRKQENKIRLSAEKEALANWKKHCAEWYREQLLPQINAVVKRYLAELPDRLNHYQDRRMQAIMERLEQQQAAYDAVVNASPDETAAALGRVSSLLEQVRMCV